MASSNTLDDLGAVLLYNIEAMKSVCLEENQALAAKNREAFFALQQKKLQASEALQYSLASWQRLQSETPEKEAWQDKIKEAYEGFRNIAAMNQNQLIAVRRSLRRIQTRMIDATKQALTGGADTYNKGGQKSQDKAKILSAGLSETA
ncbi:MAG: hypothetical protein GC136_06975 [Alphaproteobacteria bacterium]|nr:hypothetical protein [Alphaproteobacteria bacterium]